MPLFDHEHKRPYHVGHGDSVLLDGSRSLDRFRLDLTSSEEGQNPMQLAVHPAKTSRGPVVALTFRSVHCDGCWHQVLLTHAQAQDFIKAIRASITDKDNT